MSTTDQIDTSAPARETSSPSWAHRCRWRLSCSSPRSAPSTRVCSRAGWGWIAAASALGGLVTVLMNLGTAQLRGLACLQSSKR